MSRLEGRHVVLLEARMSEELASLVRRAGGEPYCVPAVREDRREIGPEVASLIDELAQEASAVVVFTTGVGATALLSSAESIGRGEELKEELRRATTVCRGPKPAGVLGRAGIPVGVRVQEPYTTAELKAALDALELEDRYAALLHYGERSEELVTLLRQRGARLRELLLYEWRLPEDTEPLRRLVREIVAGGVGAIAFTSQIQARHLFRIAEEEGLAGELAGALREHTVVAAVGPTSARALEELGVTPQVVPEHPKMGPMVRELVRYLAEHPRAA